MFELIGGRILASTTTIGTTAAAIPATALTGRISMVVRNNGAETVYLGGSGVTVAAGYPLKAAEEKAFDLKAGVVLYGITNAGSSDVRVLEGA